MKLTGAAILVSRGMKVLKAAPAAYPYRYAALLMPDWNTLEHAYGKAADVPELLAELSPDPTTETWNELWSRICHQGTVYSASFAALPVLADIAEKWNPKDRCSILALAGAILASDDVAGSRKTFMRPVASVVPRFQKLCEETLAAAKLQRQDFVYLLQAALAFDGDQFWGEQLDQLVSGEFSGCCPHCGCDLYLAIGEYGFFTTSDDWVRNPKVSREVILPAKGTMPRAGKWMLQQAQSAGQTEVADWIKCVFGSSKCPACHRGFEVPAAIAAV